MSTKPKNGARSKRVRTAAKKRKKAKRPAQVSQGSAVVAISAGPRKKRPKGPPPPRLSHHKPRAAWFRSRVAWPAREPSLAKLMSERQRARRTLAAAPLTASWQSAGPTNIGGRCTSLVSNPANPDEIMIGSAGGGVWSSSDAGKTWKPKWRAATPLEIGSLAMDPSSPTTIYCGTGEANLSADSYPGDGIYRSDDNGATWTPWARSAQTDIPRRIGAIAVDPFDSQHVMVGGVGFGRVSADRDFGGLYVTRDRGGSWQRETFISLNNYWCHAIVFDPRTRGLVFATFTAPGMASGIYRSTNGGTTWTQLKTGLPAPDRIGRTALAIAPSNSKVIYAISADASSSQDDHVLGVFKSTDGGTTWRNVAGNHFRNEGQMSYGCAIAVHPADPNHLICGGVDLHVTTNGGASWRIASHWDADRGTSAYAHADHHRLVMPQGRPGRVYSVNDGGLDVSEDGGKTWTNRSNGLAITMFYDLDVAQTDARVYGGGAQDNGTLVTNTGQADNFFELLGGDGGWMVVDPGNASHIYASYQFGGMYRFRNGTHREVSPPFKPEDSVGIWMVYITFDPNNTNTVYTANQRVYRTKNDGVSWDALTPVLDGSPVSAIEVAPANSKVVYVGTENGGFFRALDGGATWSANLASGTLPGVMITRIETAPGDARDVFITLANFGNRHVFRSIDSGASWRDIDQGKLPDVPHHALLIRPDAPRELYVCSDAGVYVTTDAGLTWLNATKNLPNVMVVDIVYQASTKSLFAATYGRSLWQLRLA
jgi:photosystem II stability/assembly factor-like uncharacterized protein